MVGFKADAWCHGSVCSAQAVQLRSSVASSIPSQKERGRLPGCWGKGGADGGTLSVFPPLERESVTSVPPSSGLMLTGCCLECCCRREKGAQGLGSTGQLDTEMSLALPESTMGSFMLLQLVSQPYWELVAKSVGN